MPRSEKPDFSLCAGAGDPHLNESAAGNGRIEVKYKDQIETTETWFGGRDCRSKADVPLEIPAPHGKGSGGLDGGEARMGIFLPVRSIGFVLPQSRQNNWRLTRGTGLSQDGNQSRNARDCDADCQESGGKPTSLRMSTHSDQDISVKRKIQEPLRASMYLIQPGAFPEELPSQGRMPVLRQSRLEKDLIRDFSPGYPLRSARMEYPVGDTPRISGFIDDFPHDCGNPGV